MNNAPAHFWRLLTHQIDLTLYTNHKFDIQQTNTVTWSLSSVFVLCFRNERKYDTRMRHTQPVTAFWREWKPVLEVVAVSRTMCVKGTELEILIDVSRHLRSFGWCSVKLLLFILSYCFSPTFVLWCEVLCDTLLKLLVCLLFLRSIVDVRCLGNVTW